MKYIKYTSVDFITRVPLTEGPAPSGPDSPDIEGLEYAFGLESQWPTNVPIYYGKVPDTASTQVAGVLEVVSLKDFKAAQKKEMQDRFDIEKYNKLSQIAKLFQLVSGQLNSKYSITEMATWNRQEREARDVLKDKKAKTPFLQSLLVDDEDVVSLAESVVKKSDEYYTALGKAIGNKRRLEKLVKEAKDVEDLQLIMVQ